jgi:hypothetical protein
MKRGLQTLLVLYAWGTTGVALAGAFRTYATVVNV